MAINRDTEMDMMQAKRQLEHADLSESVDTPGSETLHKYLVVQKKEDQPIEAFQFVDRGAAENLYNNISMNWSETYLCQILLGPKF